MEIFWLGITYRGNRMWYTFNDYNRACVAASDIRRCFGSDVTWARVFYDHNGKPAMP